MSHAIVYINLDKRVARDISAQQQLLRLGIVPEAFERTKAPGYTSQPTAYRFSAIARTPGWMGCRDSHIAIIAWARRWNLEYVTVLEDDLEILVTDKKYYDVVFTECGFTPPLFEPVIFDTTAGRLCDILYLSANTHEPLQRVSGTQHLLHARKVRSTAAIVYGKSIFDRIITDHQRGRIRKIDLYLEQDIQPRHRCYVTDRLCITQQSGFSDIEGRHMDMGFIQDRFQKNVR